MISKLLREFIECADQHVIGRPFHGSPTEIVDRTIGNNFRGLQVKGGFGMGLATAVPWIGFLGYGQEISKGIYPVYLYFKKQKRLILAYGVSATSSPERIWSGLQDPQDIEEYFALQSLGKPAKFGNSLVHSVYDTTQDFDETKLSTDLDAVIDRFHATFADSLPENSDNADELDTSENNDSSTSEIEFRILNFDHDHRVVFSAIRTKPFVLLAGLSGTGKSRLVRTLAYMTCHDSRLRDNPSKPGNFELISVKPNWHDSGELMGYVSRINGEKYITTAFLKFIAKAWRFPGVPFFLCLDEMNLAPVEQYFAEFLSIIETRAAHEGRMNSDFLLSRSQFENPKLYEQVLSDLGFNNKEGFADGISIPTNLVVVGTVNMDETTHSFSRKVLDRAMTIEMNKVDLNSGLDGTAHDWSYPNAFVSPESVLGNYTAGSEVFGLYTESSDVIDYVNRLNKILDGTPFKIAYRVRDEFLIYCYYSSLLKDRPKNWLDLALDEMTAMKVLSRIEGDDSKTSQVLLDFDGVLGDSYAITLAKLKEMRKRLEVSGYTSFWS